MPSVIAMLETIPPDHTGVHPDRQTREVRVEADTYTEGRDVIFGQVPEGWRVMWMRTA